MKTCLSPCRGFSILEVMGALAIGSVLLMGLSAIINNALDDSKGQQVALHQSQVVSALSKYINNFDNYEALRLATAGGTVALEIGSLKAASYLPTSFPETNLYGQKTCILARQRAAPSDKLDFFIVTSEGQSVPERDIAVIAASAGVGNGYILDNMAKGISWNLSTVELAALNAVTCAGGKAADNGHLASALFFDGPGQMSTDFVYRSKIPGRPELNAMTTPLNMRAFAVVQTTDALCNSADTYSQGRIASEQATGAVLSCQEGKWQRSGFWKDTVDDFSKLPLPPVYTANKIGDVRTIKDKNLAFMWDGSNWKALAVDNDGNLSVPNTLKTNRVITGTVELNTVAKAGDPCSPDGSLARNELGAVLSCKSGKWIELGSNTITSTPVYPVYKKSYHGGDVDPFIAKIIDLSNVVGARPLYMSGRAVCSSVTERRVYLQVNWYDEAWKIYANIEPDQEANYPPGTLSIGYAGECGTKGDGNVVKSSFGIQKIPDNVKYIAVIVERGATYDDYSWVEIDIYGSGS